MFIDLSRQVVSDDLYLTSFRVFSREKFRTLCNQKQRCRQLWKLFRFLSGDGEYLTTGPMISFPSGVQT